MITGRVDHEQWGSPSRPLMYSKFVYEMCFVTSVAESDRHYRNHHFTACQIGDSGSVTLVFGVKLCSSVNKHLDTLLSSGSTSQMERLLAGHVSEVDIGIDFEYDSQHLLVARFDGCTKKVRRGLF